MSHAALKLQSDERLVALVRAGSEPAFELIDRRYRAPLLRYAGRLVGPERAQDVVQQTFMNAFTSLRSDSREIALKPWLYRITHNTAINVLERKGSDVEELDESLDGVPQPPDVVDQRHRLRSLIERIGELPSRQRSAIVMRELEGRNYDEIAQRLHATSPVVRQLLHRARICLRDACGLLIPLPFLKSQLTGKTSITGGIQRAGEAGVSGVIKAAPIKLGAAVLATGAIAGAGIALPVSELGESSRAQHAPTAYVQELDKSRTRKATGLRPESRRHVVHERVDNGPSGHEQASAADRAQAQRQPHAEAEQPRPEDGSGGPSVGPPSERSAQPPSGGSPTDQGSSPSSEPPSAGPAGGGAPSQGGAGSSPGPGSSPPVETPPSGCPELPLGKLICGLLPTGP